MKQFSNEPQALINVCLTCPNPTCRNGECERYKTAAKRLKANVFPLVDIIPEFVEERCKCDKCIYGTDCSGKVFCFLVQRQCVKEGNQ